MPGLKPFSQFKPQGAPQQTNVLGGPANTPSSVTKSPTLKPFSQFKPAPVAATNVLGASGTGQASAAPSGAFQGPNSFGGIMGNTAKFAGSAAMSFIQGLEKFGKSVATAPGTIFSGGKAAASGTYESDAKQSVSDLLTGNKSSAQTVGAAVGQGANILGNAAVLGDAPGVVKTAKGVAEGSIDAAQSLGSFVKKLASKAFIGREGLDTLAELNNPEAMEFVPKSKGGGSKTFDSVVSNVTDAVGKFVKDSKSALADVKAKIPDVAVDTSKVVSKLNEGIVNAINSSMKYKGVNLASDAGIDDFIKSGVVKPEEVPTIKSIVETVKNWGDYSARGLLNLKEGLSDYYTEGANGSNRVLMNVQNGLKDLVEEAAPGVKKALRAASDNIDKADQFTKALTGKDAIQGESKLMSIARNLKNPAAGGEKLGLLTDLKNATGYDAMPELKGYSDYLKLLEKKFPGQIGTLVKTIGTRVGAAAGITGAVGGADYLYNRLTGQ